MGIRATQQTVAQLLGLPISHVRVITHFVGGGFGSKAMVWPHVTLTAMAARHVGRPRQADAHPTADVHVHRAPRGAGTGPSRWGRPRRAPDRDPAREGLDQPRRSTTGPSRPPASPRSFNACENYLGLHRLIKGNTMTPTFTRGPGEALGVFTLETAMDELAHTLEVDPVELRLRKPHAGGPARPPLVQRRAGRVPSPGRRTVSAGPGATRRRG